MVTSFSYQFFLPVPATNPMVPPLTGCPHLGHPSARGDHLRRVGADAVEVVEDAAEKLEDLVVQALKAGRSRWRSGGDWLTMVSDDGNG